MKTGERLAYLRCIRVELEEESASVLKYLESYERRAKTIQKALEGVRQSIWALEEEDREGGDNE